MKVLLAIVLIVISFWLWGLLTAALVANLTPEPHGEIGTAATVTQP